MIKIYIIIGLLCDADVMRR